MKTNNANANRFRIRSGPGRTPDSYGNNGAFMVPSPLRDGTILAVIASDGGGWDHVSVSLNHRCPTWDEMCSVKALFFRPDEWAVQFHPPIDQNISFHNYCLHLWRPQTAAERALLNDEAPELPTPGPIPIPPPIMVAPPDEV